MPGQMRAPERMSPWIAPDLTSHDINVPGCWSFDALLELVQHTAMLKLLVSHILLSIESLCGNLALLRHLTPLQMQVKAASERSCLRCVCHEQLPVLLNDGKIIVEPAAAAKISVGNARFKLRREIQFSQSTGPLLAP